MLQVRNITHWFGDVKVLDQISFNLNRGDRAGLIGPNGSGKTTLLRILTGQLEPDRGSVHLAPATVRVGYLPQALHFPTQAKVGKVLQSAKSELMAAETHLAQLAERISVASGADRGQSQGSGLQALMVAYDRALAEFEALGGSQVQSALRADADAVLAGLGMADVDQAQPVDSLSGGQKTRLGLARLLLMEPDLLLLDEPTNHLDISALAWLETYLSAYTGAILVVSHDRTFLDQTVNRILSLDEATHTLREHAGNYTDYAMAMDTELEKQWASYKEQQARMQRLAASIHKLSGQARGIEQETIHFHYRRIAKDLARRAVVQKRRLERMLEAEDLVEKPGMTWKMKLEFPDTPRSGQDALHIEDMLAGYGDHNNGRPVLDKVNLHVQYGERVALIGPNGSGKTTLLRCIAGELAPWSGDIRLGRGVRLGYMAQAQETLDAASTPYGLIRDAAPLTETEARSFLHYFLFAGDEVFVPVGRLSFGERSRLALALLAARGCNLLLLDEPINHLDIPSREGFERAMARFQGTVIAVLHDRYFIERFATTIWSVEPRPDGLPVSTVEVLAA